MSKKTAPSFNGAECVMSSYLPPMTSAELWHIVSRMAVGKPPGIDGILLRAIHVNWAYL